MSYLSWKEWLGIIVVTIVIATLTWTGLNLGRMLYTDWAFLHAIRVATEQQPRQQAVPVQQAVPGK